VNIDVSYNSWGVRLIGGRSGESKPVGVVRNANKTLFFVIIRAGDRADN